MATEVKKYLDHAGLTKYDEKIKKVISDENVKSLQDAKSYIDEKIEAAQCETKEVFIPYSWVEDPLTGGYLQTVVVSGITERDNPIVDVILGSDIGTDTLALKAWGCVSRITTASDSITLYAYNNKPEVEFNIQLKVVR